MGVQLSTALLNRLWAILEAGETGTLCKTGNRIKRGTPAGWLKDAMAKAPADYPQVDIEVGRRGTHSGYNAAPNFGIESAQDASEIDWPIERSELVTITTKTDRVDSGGVNVLREAIVDDIMRAGPKLGISPPVVSVGDPLRRSAFTYTQRYTRNKGERPYPGQITTIEFAVQMEENGRATLVPETTNADPVGWINLALNSAANGTTNLRGWLTDPIFPGYDDTLPLATRQSLILSGGTAYLTGTVFPNMTACGCRGLIFHQGLNGEQYPHPVSINGDPRTWQPELPKSTGQVWGDLCRANNFAWGVGIRPTVQDPAGANIAPFGQGYEADPVATVRAKIKEIYDMGGRLFYFDSSVKDTSYTRFTAAEVQGWLSEFPGIELMFEWYDPSYMGLAGVRAFHQPPGAAEITPPGYLPGPTEQPTWDAYGAYWLSTTEDDPTADAAYLSAAYGRGAQLYLYVGSWPDDPTWAVRHANLWRSTYAGA